MENNRELLQEREYTAKVQQLLYAVIQQSVELSGAHTESVRAILADAWEELRLKPTAISQQELDQLATDINHYLVRKSFTDDQGRPGRKRSSSAFTACATPRAASWCTTGAPR